MTNAVRSPSRWQQPPAPIASQYDRPRLPTVILSPDRRWLLELERSTLPSIGEMNEPIVNLAGRQINSQTREPARASFYTGIHLQSLDQPGRVTIDLPEAARIRNLRWSPYSRYLAFTLTQPQGLELWLLDLAQAQARQLTRPGLNGTYGHPCDWLSETEGLVCKMVPSDQPPPPAPPVVPRGPKIEEHQGSAAPSRTFTNLLRTPQDELLFEYYLTSVLERVDLQGDRQVLTPPLLITEATPSPDGNWILMETLHRPFSYQVPLWRFPKRTTLFDRLGTAVYTLADLPLDEAILPQRDSVRPGRRWSSWRADRPATVYWVEALDGGNSQVKVPFRDAVYQLAAPFESKPQLLWKPTLRFQGIRWGQDRRAIGAEFWYDSRQQRLWKLDPTQENGEPELLDDRNYQDAYRDRGKPVMGTGPYGWPWSTLLFAADAHTIYLNGYGASPEGVYPFLDQWHWQTGTTERLWQAQDPHFESVVALLDGQAERLVIYRESEMQPPNYFCHDRPSRRDRPLTQYPDPLPWYTHITRQVVRYPRRDGLMLSATLYLPPGHDPAREGPLPTLLWVYPQEHRSRDTASQVTVASHAFSRPWRTSVLFLLTQGYAILQNPTLPIVGEGEEEPNDTYLEQLTLGAEAAVNDLVDRGISERDRIAVGGHSYGAFTVVNLLAHTNLFQTGIARSGAYNRTLTPFGFQGEQRTFWQTPDTYIRMSPFAYAHQITQPLLLIHGAEDDNSGTYPLQSERLYEAIKGLGGTVRWVVLPEEGHTYRSREAAGHVLWEMVTWLDRYLKNKE